MGRPLRYLKLTALLLGTLALVLALARQSAWPEPPRPAIDPHARPGSTLAEGPAQGGAARSASTASGADGPDGPGRSLAPSTRPAPTRSAARDANGSLAPQPTRLADASPAEIRAALDDAIREARRTRPVTVAPAVLERAARDGSVRVVFDTSARTDATQLARTLDAGAPASAVEDLRVFPLLGHGAAKLSADALRNLIAETDVLQIEIDGVHRASLLESVPQIGASAAHAASHDGDGAAVAVIDTGVDVDHPMFAGRVVEEACFSLGEQCPNGEDEMLGDGAAAPCAFAGCDHGTHVAGIAVGDAASGPLVGVAPHATLIAINVFSEIDGDPGAYTSDILAAMQHVLALSAFHDVAAVNLSLGGEPFTSASACDQASPAQRSAVNQLRSAGIATVAASGNEAFTNAITSPGCLSNVISVGSVDEGDEVSSFSNSADFLTLLAPGQSIQSAAVGGGTRNGSGTSMATPHVAGAIAAVREALPDASVAAIQNALVLSGDAVLDDRNGITTPRVRVDLAIAMLEAAGPGPGGDDAPPDDDGDAGGDGDLASTNGPAGAGGGCGLVGIEPFLVLLLTRRGRAFMGRREARA